MKIFFITVKKSSLKSIFEEYTILKFVKTLSFNPKIKFLILIIEFILLYDWSKSCL